MARAFRVPASPALEEMLAADAANGIDVFDSGPRLEPGPPVQVEPLRQAVIPPPDWRAEERERARRQAAETDDPEPPPAQSLTAAPAKKRRKAKPGATPNLDTVRGWRSNA